VRQTDTKSTLNAGDRAPVASKLSARGVGLFYQSVGKPPVQALADVTFDILPGQFVSIVGPSGCGKTTFLMAVAGLLPTSSGTIAIDGKIVKKPGPDRAVVFQDASLLPWRTVVKNIEYGLQLRKHPKSEARATALRLVEMVGLSGFEQHYPRQLSGGMRQRVNVARALAMNPEVLLLDEPFAALDAQTREYMQSELLNIWSNAKKTALFITHQIDEAIYLSDRVIVFGRQPGHVRADISIDLDRPRGLDVKKTAQFAAYEDQIWKIINEEGRLARQERSLGRKP
jgi:ABC-type nitrate/sulfonate/bicarbonate transport system ATPase subunit